MNCSPLSAPPTPRFEFQLPLMVSHEHELYGPL